MRRTLPRERQKLPTLDDYLTLFEDRFNGSAINANRWLVTDTQNNWSVANGRLSCAGTLVNPGAWGDPVLRAPGVLRKPGVTLECEITPTNNTTSCIVGFNTDSAPSVSTEQVGFYPWSDGNLYIQSHDGESVQPKPVGYSGGTSYRLRTVLKNPGALWYYSTDGGITWPILWETALGSTSLLYPMWMGWDMPFTSQYFRVFQSSALPPLINDDFSAWSGWTDVTGTWGVTGGKAYSVTDANADRAVRNLGKADGILDCDCLGTYGTGGGIDYSQPDLVFRHGDSNNFLFIELWDGAVYLRKKDDGAYTNLASAAQTTTNGTTYAIRVLMLGNAINVYVDGTLKISYTLAGGDTKYAAYTNYGMLLLKGGAPGTDARWDNFKLQAGLP